MVKKSEEQEMTDREKAIVMAYTGVCMLKGKKFGVFHAYIEDIMGRPVYTHELAMQSISDEIKEKSRDDFIKLCREEQEPCEDEYVKVPKKALKYRTAGMVAYNAEWLKNNFDIERAVICGAQEPCEDAISRQAVVGYLCTHCPDDAECFEDCDDIKNIKSLPPVNPTKTGYWIFVDKAHEHAHCSECDYGNVDLLDGRPHNYCPNCGCRMVEPQESEDKE